MSGFVVEGNISATAVATAHFRALESARADRLFTDALASTFVGASGLPVSQVGLSDVVAGRVYESVAVRTTYLDRAVVNGCALGMRQVVILAAGLDTRAWRLGLDTEVDLFEIDLPGLFEFKESALAGHTGAQTTCRRHVVSTDLLSPHWFSDLVESGFDSSLPTVWIAEGIFIYLTDAQNQAIVDTITEFSVAGSRLAFVHWGPGCLKEEQTKAMASRVEQAGFSFRSMIDSPSTWLTPLGWSVEYTTIKQYGCVLGRTIPYDEDELGPVAWMATAVRQSA